MKPLLLLLSLLVATLSYAQVSSASLSITPGGGISDGLYTSAVRVKVAIMQNHRPCTGKVSAITSYTYSAHAYQYKGVKYFFKNGNLVDSKNELVVNGVGDYKDGAKFSIEVFMNTGVVFEVTGYANGGLQHHIIQEDLPEFDADGKKTKCVDRNSFTMSAAKAVQPIRLTDRALESRIDTYLNKQGQTSNENLGVAVNTDAGSDWNDSINQPNTNPQQADYTKAYDGQKYVPKYVNNGRTPENNTNARAEQVRLQQSYEARQQQQHAFEQSLAAQNQQALAKYEQAFQGDQLSMGLAQSAQVLGSAIAGFNDYNAMGTAAANLLGGLIADGERRREERAQEEALWREQERLREEKRAYITKLVTAREVALGELPAPNYPNATTSSSLKTAYFYSLYYNADSLQVGSASMQVTDIFAINQYSDATWPFINRTQEKLAEFATNAPTLIGYFESYDAAYNSMTTLTTSLAANAVQITFLPVAEEFDTLTVLYDGTSGATPQQDFWGNTVAKPKALKEPETHSKKEASSQPIDFWGETVPIKTEQVPSETAPTKATTPVQDATTSDDDFWGTSVEIKEDKTE
ncbi:hypothetical protein [Aequorivita sp. Q41]|uniref:hypothetical protein n=1 Tax=Aequorivita sp. Q41 TaxID=3153300 RepID=UPI0032421AC9